MISLAFLYVAQEAPFLGVVQVVVYTGAVMMLFLFVLMLVGVDASDSLVETIRGQRWIGLLAGIGLARRARRRRRARDLRAGPSGSTAANADTNPSASRAWCSATTCSRSRSSASCSSPPRSARSSSPTGSGSSPRVGQKERADARVAAGGTSTPLPAPGVYARHNAMDVPALDPDGQPDRALGAARAAHPRPGGRRAASSRHDDRASPARRRSVGDAPPRPRRTRPSTADRPPPDAARAGLRPAPRRRSRPAADRRTAP